RFTRYQVRCTTKTRGGIPRVTCAREAAASHASRFSGTGTDSRRGGLGRLRFVRRRRVVLLLAIDQILQLLARLEVRHPLGRHVHLVARLRVASLARLTLAQPEAAESAKLDLLAAVEGIDDALEHRVDDDLGVLLGQIGNPRYL